MEQTSTLFIPHMDQFRTAHLEAKKSLELYIETVKH